MLAWVWCRIARAASRHAGDAWHDDRVTGARYGVQWLLPEAGLLWQRVRKVRDLTLPLLAPHA